MNQDLVYVIDDDESLRSAIDLLLTIEGFVVETYASAVDFLGADLPSGNGCVLTNLEMQGNRIRNLAVARESDSDSARVSSHGLGFWYGRVSRLFFCG